MHVISSMYNVWPPNIIMIKKRIQYSYIICSFEMDTKCAFLLIVWADILTANKKRHRIENSAVK